MKGRAPLRWGTWLAAAAIAMAGCGQKPFVIADRRVCQTVDATGKPGPEVTKLSVRDRTVYIWFSYLRARPGQAVKVKVTYTDAGGAEASDEVRDELKAGSGSSAAQFTGLNGGPLVPGKYQAEITNESGAAYGGALTFEVTGPSTATGSPAPVGQPES